ncbi:MAG: hypothetical protein A2X32_09565 [Elusimicrobia bacterium GWC2_64_44]|nr:MAG: hypothetical protein A2X32_09565 [Elusimicrobia bacterium GWC2_64_44]
MKIVSALLLTLAIAAPARAADFSDLQGLNAPAVSKINPYPNPSNPDSCYLTGLKEGLCSFKCRSGETFQIKPVKPEAASLYEKCGGGDYRAPQAPDAGAIWAQINNQHNPFPQPQTTLDYCVFTEFKNNKCLFKCESGAILTEPAQKPDFSTGEPAGACATMIIRPIKPAFGTKAAAATQTYNSYGKYPTAQKASEVLTWAANGFKFAKTELVDQAIVVHGLSDYRFRLTYKAAAPLAIESSPLFKVELDAFERMFDMANRLEDDGATVVTHEVVTYEGGYYYVIGYFPGTRGAARQADKKVRACVFNSYAGNVCNYKCNDGKPYTQPLATPGPWDNNPVQLCPQLVFPF